MDILQQFGDLSEDILNKRKYAKWKAAYIHNCLKVGDKPIPGPPGETGTDDNLIHKSLIDNDTPETNITPPTDNVSTPSTPSPAINPGPVVTPGTANSQVTWPQFPTEPTAATVPTPQASTPSVPLLPTSSEEVANLTPEQIEKAQKYCKWAASALTYDDVKTAVNNLHKALNLLQLGKE